MRLLIYTPHCSLVLSLCAAHSIAFAGVRHSRSINGTGQPIPKSQYNRPGNVDPNVNQGIPVPNQFQPMQAPSDTSGTSPNPPMQVPPPVIVPPPMPVQIPTQNTPNNDTQTANPTTATDTPPVQVAPQTPVAAPVPVTGGQPSDGQAQQQVTPPAPAIVPPPMQVQVPSQMKSEPVPQMQGTESNAQMPALPPQLQPEGLPETPAYPPEKSQFASPSQNYIPIAPDIPSGQPVLPDGSSVPSYLGQPNLAPAPAGRMSGGRYLTATYGMAGCGLGSMIFTNNTRSEQWLAAFINEAFIPQSTAISTGTSNCFDADEERSQAEQEIFIDTNFHTLKTDVVRGDGETLRAYADLVGCYKDDLYDTFASLSQGQYGFIFSDSLPQSVAERFRDSLKRSRALKTRCDRLF